jgi:hypothetical protein
MVQAAADMRRTARGAVDRARQHLSGLADEESLGTTPGRTTSEQA